MSHIVDNLKKAISEYKQSIENDTLNLKNDTLNDTLKLSDKEKNIIDLIKKQKDISISEIMLNTGFSRPTVTRSIDYLKKRFISKSRCKEERILEDCLKSIYDDTIYGDVNE